jgi:hypothetical protein
MKIASHKSSPRQSNSPIEQTSRKEKSSNPRDGSNNDTLQEPDYIFLGRNCKHCMPFDQQVLFKTKHKQEFL